jgi:hypothetical protein
MGSCSCVCNVSAGYSFKTEGFCAQYYDVDKSKVTIKDTNGVPTLDTKPERPLISATVYNCLLEVGFHVCFQMFSCPNNLSGCSAICILAKFADLLLSGFQV